MDTTVQDEISRVYASSVYSEFETCVMDDIISKSMGSFVNSRTAQKELIESYWEDKLKTN